MLMWLLIGSGVIGVVIFFVLRDAQADDKRRKQPRKRTLRDRFNR